jgi:hypothetical protein
LLQPKVDTTIAIAMIVAPVAPKIAFSAAVATRSSGALRIASIGSVRR